MIPKFHGKYHFFLIVSSKVSFSNNNKYLLVNSLNSKIHLWDHEHSDIVKEYTGHLNKEVKIDTLIYEFQK